MRKNSNESKASSHFRLVIKLFFDKAGWGAQSEIASITDVPRSVISDFLSGNKPISEKHRETLAEYHGYNYEDMLVVGRELEKINNKKDKDEFINFNVELLKKVREKYNFSTADFGYWIKVKDIIYEFKEKGFVPITFSEVSIIFDEIKKRHSDFESPLKDIVEN